MGLSIDIEIDKKNKEVFLQIENAINITEEAIRRAYYFIGKDLTKVARRSIIRGPKTGRIYKKRIRGGRSRRHQASAPGEPPANFRGNLQKTVDFLVHGSERMTFGAGDEEINYARFLEDGTTKMAARPYLIRAIKEREKNIENYFEAQLKRELTG